MKNCLKITKRLYPTSIHTMLEHIFTSRSMLIFFCCENRGKFADNFPIVNVEKNEAKKKNNSIRKNKIIYKTVQITISNNEMRDEE